jgi:hypothetical protein
MPIHDWARVGSAAFHDFHTRWIAHLTESLNGGLLPPGYYAMTEQWAGGSIADVLTLQTPLPVASPGPEGGVAVTQSPPHVRRKLALPPTARGLRRTLTIRHVSGHRVVALIEVVSPANKDRPVHVAEFVDKATTVLWRGIHLLLVDLFPPGPHDPRGIHGAIWERWDDEPYSLPPGEPLTLASYVAGRAPEAYLEHLAFGSPLAEMPLFLNPDRYINVPLETTYMTSYRGMPGFWREALEKPQSPPD